MKELAISLVLATSIGWILPSAALAAKTDQERHVKRVSKYAVTSSDLTGTKRKGACYCQGGGLDRKVGDLVYSEFFDVVEQEFTLEVDCSVPAFDPNGAEVSRSTCSTFVPLAK